MFQSLKKLFPSAHARPAPKTRPRVEGLEDRKLMTAGITLGTDGIIRVEGHDDASRGEMVSVRTLTNNSLTAYDDQIQVTMSYGRRTEVQTFDLWKSAGRRESVRAVTRVVYNGYDGNDRFVNTSRVIATADGGAGDDVLKGGGHVEVLRGGLGNDTLTGGLSSDILDGGAGTDKLVESADDDFVLSDFSIKWGDVSMDQLSGIEVADMTGGDSANHMNADPNSPFAGDGFTGTVTMHGGKGDDTLNGGEGANFLYGESGDDSILGNRGVDKLYGGDGSDRLNGDYGNDAIYGGKGKDYLYGGWGDDYLNGGYDRKVDHLYGQGGTDTFLQHVWYVVWVSFRDNVHDRETGETVYQIQN